MEFQKHNTGSIFLPGNTIQDYSFSTYNPATDSFEDHSFSEFLLDRKWLVLYFYPADFTFVCPTELADIATYHDQLKEIDVEVIAFSTDSKYSHLAWRKAEKLLENVNFLMASDLTGEIAEAFGVYDAEGGTAFRGTFIINPDGALVGSEVNFYNVGRNAAELVRKMQAFTYLYERPHQVCPAKWEKGQEALTPSEKLVGRVYEYVK